MQQSLQYSSHPLLLEMTHGCQGGKGFCGPPGAAPSNLRRCPSPQKRLHITSRSSEDVSCLSQTRNTPSSAPHLGSQNSDRI